VSEIVDSIETGEICTIEVEGLGYPLRLPYVWLPGEERETRIASLNLLGKTRWNRDLGRLLAQRIREAFSDLAGYCLLTVVEKALQLAQVVGDELGVADIAIAYNRIKPHMEPARRAVIQVGADSITSGGKFLALYERDINLLAATATRGVIVVEDVVTTGGTLAALESLLEQVTRLKKLPRPIPLSAAFAVAVEGKRTRLPALPVHALCRLPDPTFRPASATTSASQETLWKARGDRSAGAR
jgi:adenine phosphoribosyltransferase